MKTETTPLTAAVPVYVTPPALKDREPKIEIGVRVPTMFERDNLASSLLRAGVVHYNQDQIRDLCLAGVDHIYPADQFDELTAGLRDLWEAGDSTTEAKRLRTIRYAELELDNAERPEGEKMTEAYVIEQLEAIKPDIIMKEAYRVRLTAVQQEIASKYEPLQKAFADLAEQNSKRAWYTIKAFVVGWKGLDQPAPAINLPGPAKPTGLSQLEAEWLRRRIGSEAFNEMSDFIMAMHTLDEDEEKNLASLIESFTGPTGSPATGLMSEDARNGILTGKPTRKTRATSSRKTRAPSSNASKRSRTRTAASKPSPTVEP